MSDDYTQDSSVTGTQGDYGAPQPQENVGMSQPETGSAFEQTVQSETPTGISEEPESQTGSYEQSNGRTGAYQTQPGSYEQPNSQTGAYQQQTGSYEQNPYSRQNTYSNPGTNSYTNTNAYTNTNPYTNGNTYSNPYQQQSSNQSQNLYYGQTSQNKDDGIGFGVASLVLGILSIFTFVCCVNYIFAVLAIIFGIVQLVKSKKKGMAIAGIITAAISIIIATIFWVAAASEGSMNLSTFDSYQQMMQEDSL